MDFPLLQRLLERNPHDRCLYSVKSFKIKYTYNTNSNCCEMNMKQSNKTDKKHTSNCILQK